MTQAEQTGVDSIPLDQIDISDPTLSGNDGRRPWFARHGMNP